MKKFLILLFGVMAMVLVINNDTALADDESHSSVSESTSVGLQEIDGKLYCFTEDVGINIPRLCGAQAYMTYYEQGFETIDSIEEAQPGDLLFYQQLDYDGVSPEDHNWNETHHTAIYLGNGKVLEATSAGDGVVRVYDVREDRGIAAYLYLIGRYKGND